jgi:signal transduction histidine kinase
MFNNAVKRLLSVNTLRDISEIERIKHGLPEILMKMRAGDSMIIKLFIGDELLQLLVRATEFRLRNEDYTLVSLQNIHAELEEKEIESWQKMIRVLTHEIMNSITPISSLAATVNEMMYDEESQQSRAKLLDKDDFDNIQHALKTIMSRSQGLLSFVELYRNLTRIPKPNFRYFAVDELFNRTIRLMLPKLEEAGIKIMAQCQPAGLMLTADPDLVDQVIINLILNAADALKNRQDARILLSAYPNKNGRVVVEIQDNGPGIKPDIMDKIFMPFFTSKKDGSGIGLSLSRQIMHLHKGTISVKSWPDEGALFTLTF